MDKKVWNNLLKKNKLMETTTENEAAAFQNAIEHIGFLLDELDILSKTGVKEIAKDGQSLLQKAKQLQKEIESVKKKHFK